MATVSSPVTSPTASPVAAVPPTPALMVAVPSDPASAAAFAAGNLFVFLCTPIGQEIATSAVTAGKAITDVVKGLAQDVIDIFRGLHI
ncbi:MAG TPA: hypothetical protein VMT86_03910 [Bryobacteraceae bacterium]|nr:hypothetical protein [Bryobacteraceae bacterium]